MFSQYRVALLLYRSFNDEIPVNEWLFLNFDQIKMRRQSNYQTLRKKLLVGMSSRLRDLTPKIPAPPNNSSNTWMSLLATTGLPKVGSVGFTDNYMSDAIPPPSYNYEEKSSQSNSEGLQMKMFQPSGPVIAPKLLITNSEMEYLKDSGARTLTDVRKTVRGDVPLSATTGSEITSCVHSPIAKDEIQRMKDKILKTDFDDLAEPASRSYEEDCSSLTENEIFLFEDEHHQGQFNKKPIGKLTQLIMSQPFAQNWFFKSPESASQLIENLQQSHERAQKEKRELIFIASQQE